MSLFKSALFAALVAGYSYCQSCHAQEVQVKKIELKLLDNQQRGAYNATQSTWPVY